MIGRLRALALAIFALHRQLESLAEDKLSGSSGLTPYAMQSKEDELNQAIEYLEAEMKKSAKKLEG